MAINDRVRTVMDHAGFTLEQLIEKHLRLVLEAKERSFSSGVDRLRDEPPFFAAEERGHLALKIPPKNEFLGEPCGDRHSRNSDRRVCGVIMVRR